MTEAERLLMIELVHVNQQVAGFVLEFADGDMHPEAVKAFVRQLASIAEKLLDHAQARQRIVIDATPANTCPQLLPAADLLHRAAASEHQA